MACCTSAWKPRISEGNSKESCVAVCTRMELFLGGVRLARLTHMQSFAVMQTSSWGLCFLSDTDTGLKSVSSAA